MAMQQASPARTSSACKAAGETGGVSGAVRGRRAPGLAGDEARPAAQQECEGQHGGDAE